MHASAAHGAIRVEMMAARSLIPGTGQSIKRTMDMNSELEKNKNTVTVAIIDDSSVVRKQIRTMLMDHSYIRVVGEAGDIAGGLDLLLEQVPDFLILDISMPGGSGFQLLEYMKMRIMRSKVIVLTNYSDSCYRSKAENLGADFFFDKSHDFESIINVIGGYAERGTLDGMKKPAATT